MSEAPETPVRWPSDRAERARAMVDAGVIGGARPGAGRPRVARASELAAQAAQEHADIIVQALVAGVTTGSPEARARTATRWIKLAQGQDTHELRERQEDRQADAWEMLSRDDLDARAADVIVGLLVAGEMDLDQIRALAQAEPVTDAVVVPDD